MSIPALIECSTELKRLAVAGSRFARDDYRLKRLMEPLRNSGTKAPIFNKVADGVEELLNSPEDQSSEKLLGASTLVGAILATRASTEVAGELTPLQGIDGQYTGNRVSAKVLKPLIMALTSSGSGRQQIIEDAFQQQHFHDIRLIKPSLAALEDRYTEIADFVAEKILPLHGPYVLPFLLRDYDPKSKKKIDARRLEVIGRIQVEEARELLLDGLENGAKDIKVAALKMLGALSGTAPIILEQCKAKNKEVRKAALAALPSDGRPEVIKTLVDALSTEHADLVIDSVRAQMTSELTLELLSLLET